MKFKKKDFVLIDYNGKLEDGSIFDTTNKEKAVSAGLANENSNLGSVTICVGQGHLLPGLDEFIVGKDKGEYQVKLAPEKAFGKKNLKLLQLIPMKVFKKEKIQPFPGLEVNIDNNYGLVRTVSGGRVYVDFNHPLAGKNIIYELTIHKKVNDPLEKVKSIFKNELNSENIKLKINENVLFIYEKIPDQALSAVKKRVLELVPELKDVKTSEPQPKKKEEKQ